MGKKNRFLRTCIVCGKKGKKGEFFRIVLKEGCVILDKKQCLSGRGAYICTSMCFESVKKNQLERAFKSKVVYDKQSLKIQII